MDTMKATCPNNPSHQRFVTTAHVMQEWVVDKNGNFIEASQPSIQTTHGPDPENVWNCYECGSQAIVSP